MKSHGNVYCRRDGLYRRDRVIWVSRHLLKEVVENSLERTGRGKTGDETRGYVMVITK